MGGSKPAEITKHEHEALLEMKKVLMSGTSSGSNAVVIRLNANGEIVIAPPTSASNGQKTVTTAGTAEALAGTTAARAVSIKALTSNTGNVYVGDSGVDSTNGFILHAGEAIDLDIDDLADIFLDVDTDGEGVSFIFNA